MAGLMLLGTAFAYYVCDPHRASASSGPARSTWRSLKPGGRPPPSGLWRSASGFSLVAMGPRGKTEALRVSLGERRWGCTVRAAGGEAAHRPAMIPEWTLRTRGVDGSQAPWPYGEAAPGARARTGWRRRCGFSSPGAARKRRPSGIWGRSKRLRSTTVWKESRKSKERPVSTGPRARTNYSTPPPRIVPRIARPDPLEPTTPPLCLLGEQHLAHQRMTPGPRPQP